jgi:glycosyltransferase involved in cell wall biosynthesis
MTPALSFQGDAYTMSVQALMGRNAAGNGFLRAAVANRGNDSLWAFTSSNEQASTFGDIVRSIDPKAKTRWLRSDRLDLLERIGTLYLTDPHLENDARLRLRAGPLAYSLCGLIHTTAGHPPMEAITNLLTVPVMPWDALVCTSTAVAESVRKLIEAELEYLKWRFGAAFSPTLPHFPVIPLGVHCGDYESQPGDREAARAHLNIAEDEVVALYVGRLSFMDKANPYAMYQGLQVAAQRSRKKVTLIQAGWFADKTVEGVFRDSARAGCPDVRVVFLDGRDATQLRRAWRGSDFFISLADSIQETFGLTPIEAMAAGLPVVVSDWNGYRDTVRDGVDGFRIPTRMPRSRMGHVLAHRYEAKIEGWRRYFGMTAATVSVDMQVLAERLYALVESPELRTRMGEAGLRRARAVFDWNAVYRRYQELWNGLAAIRNDPASKALAAGAPKAAASRMNPYRQFSHYPTDQILPTTMVSVWPGVSEANFADLASNPLFSYGELVLPPTTLVTSMLLAVGEGEVSVQGLAQAVGAGADQVLIAVAVLAKMGLVRLLAA